MKFISYLILKFRLILSFSGFGLLFFYEFFLRSKTFMLTLFFQILLTFSLFLSYFTPLPPVIQVVYQKNRSAAEAEIYTWEQFASTIPSRVAFLQLEQLHRYIGEEEQALEYRRRAFFLDPNNQEFAEDDLSKYYAQITPEPIPTVTVFPVASGSGTAN